VKVLGYILTAAVVLVGADVFVVSSDSTARAANNTTTRQEPMSLQGGSGIPTPPTDAY